MTVWIVPRGPWHQCLLDGIPHLVRDWQDTHLVVETGEVSGVVWRLGVDHCMVLGPHLMDEIDRYRLPYGSRLYETENRFACPRVSGLVARQDLSWFTWSFTQANQQRFSFWPLRPATAPQLPLPHPRRPVALFYGSMNLRRAWALERIRAALGERGFELQVLPFGTFGPELHVALDTAAVVVNIHFYTQPTRFGDSRCGLLETFRILPALARGAVVVTEESCDEAQERLLLNMFPTRFYSVAYDNLASVVLRQLERRS